MTISGAEDGALYTLINTDPDAPDPANPHMGEILHWVVTNIKGGDVATGDEPVTYMCVQALKPGSKFWPAACLLACLGLGSALTAGHAAARQFTN